MKKTKTKQERKTPVWEWVISAIGVLIFTFSAGLLIYEAVHGNDSPPDIRLEAESVTEGRNGYVVKFRAMNEGGSTAARLQIKGFLKKNGEVVEVSEAGLEYLPSHSERQGGLIFKIDPRTSELELRAVGYEKP
jgi:uncharacterized protein (TIGR02588 family)